MIEDILKERGKTHGDYKLQSSGSQWLKQIMRSFPNWEDMSDGQRESLDMICVKISRIGHGNPNHKDSWDDIQGYAKLAADGIID